MKLGELRGAIRKTKGNPYINVFPFPGTDKGFRFYIQKTPLLEELERVYPGGKSVETGLDFNVETGLLKSSEYDATMALSPAEKASAFAGSATASADDDLLADSPSSDDGLLDLDEAPSASSDLDDILV